MYWKRRGSAGGAGGRVARQATFSRQRFRLALVLADSPSLSTKIEEFAEFVYPHAVEQVADETGLHRRIFPATCPYRAEQLLDPTFMPGEQ